MLIDSIFRNYYIPPVTFSVPQKKGALTAVKLFMDGLIPFKYQSTGETLWYRDNLSLSGYPTRGVKHLLPEKYRSIFKTKQIVCAEYPQTRGTSSNVFSLECPSPTGESPLHRRRILA
ncbi:hypothetical protein E1B28_012713 [Marasmius oreades]|uniref:Uncharacterized protein n=1 Tax=Marasmius oreades TaxID=181124 RepID=A0A9P7UP85_9AGAR|nr:uncharacterized protein E1B28_012713 [Marasmius oreades]KAG7088745.1 hypothetical protein E1B28_012713 [Marasmius oreades]